MNKELLFLLLTKIIKDKCLFILGSGVSINYAKPVQQTKTLIKDDICQKGSFLVEVNKNKSELAKLLTVPSDGLELTNDILWLYHHTTSNEAFKNLYLKHIQPTIPNKCPEYEIFNLCRSGKIFNFNHDGLAELFIRNKNLSILHPHGKFPMHAKDFLNSLHPMEYDYRLNLFDSWGIHPPTKESIQILETKPYIEIKRNFNDISEIFIIGYSFCETSTGILNDEHSFNLILDLAKFHKKRIWIINPNPENLFNKIHEDSKGQFEIINMPVKWDLLTRAILDTLGFYPLASLKRGAEVAHMISNNYQIPVNTPQSWLDLASMKLTNFPQWKFSYHTAYHEYIFKYGNFTIYEVIKKYFDLLDEV